MQSKLYTFKDIFEAVPEDNSPKINRIVIPIIQRDYAQGRKNAEVTRVRERFIESLYNAITEKPVTLDFVYGSIEDNGELTLLDGQQRLTTLFLLYWYAAKKGGVGKEEYLFLNNFTYRTRYSARDFCEYLINAFEPEFNKRLSEEIVNENWFPYDWLKDSTVSSMLVMLDTIQTKFKNVPDVWEKLIDGAITFYFLPIKEMGLTDELYIKMNSRGKPLTQFEHFKAELEQSLQEVDTAAAKRIADKIDIDWTDLLWQYRDNEALTDNKFLRYFRFICDIICYWENDTPQGKNLNEFDLIKKYFSKACRNVQRNIQTLKDFFDCWLKLDGGETPKEFFNGLFGHDHSTTKLKAFNIKIDLFENCLELESNRFPFNRKILLYAVITYLLHKDKITRGQFLRRLRTVNNLTLNSYDEMSDSATRQGGNRLPAILKQVDSVILKGKLIPDSQIGLNFNSYQVKEETEKLLWTEKHPSLAESLYILEDHNLLHGQIAVIGLENSENFLRFASLMSCDKNLVDCALLTIDNYAQSERGWGGKYQFGTKNNPSTWESLFHKSAAGGFDNTKSVLNLLLSETTVFTNAYLKDKIDKYLKDCEYNNRYNWIYYYIKYDVFRPDRYGKYYWSDYANAPYVFSALWTEKNESENACIPFLKAVNSKYLSREHYGKRIVFEGKYIILTNSSYVIKDCQTDGVADEIDVLQNQDGTDAEDRILKMKAYIKKNYPTMTDNQSV